MIRLLAIDTAGATAGAAVAVEGEVVSCTVQARAYRHAEGLFRLIDHALASAGLAASDLTAVAVTRGPGSFTGLRVGIAAAKGMAYALGIPVAGVSTLEALARGAMPFPGVILPVLDARKFQVYGAVFDGRSGRLLVPERAWAASELAAEASRLAAPCLALGSGLGPYGDLFETGLEGRLLRVGCERWGVSPGQVAVLGLRETCEGRAVPAALLTPVYHRLSEAEEKRKTAASRR